MENSNAGNPEKFELSYDLYEGMTPVPEAALICRACHGSFPEL